MAVSLSKVFHHGAVTALLLFPSPSRPTHLFVARGSTLSVHSYPSLQRVLSHQWSHHQHRIHGLAQHGDSLLIAWGGPYCQLLQLRLSVPALHLYADIGRVSSFIWCVACYDCGAADCQQAAADSGLDVAVGLSSNEVLLCRLPLPPPTASASSSPPSGPLRPRATLCAACPVRCLVYSLALSGRCVHSLQAVSGTVFSSILVWRPLDCPPSVLHELCGHDGSVFHISAASLPSQLYSVSDDRTIRCWRRDEEEGALGFRNSWTAYGHESRVWRVMQLQGRQAVVTGGEDDTVRVWEAGRQRMLWREKGRKGGVWALAEDSQRGRIIAGFGDGRVRLLPLSLDSAEQDDGDGSDSREQGRRWRLSDLLRPLQANREEEKRDDEDAGASRAAGAAETEYCRVIIAGRSDDEAFVATSTGRVALLQLLPTAASPASTASHPSSCTVYRHSPHAPIVFLSLSPDRRWLLVGDGRLQLLLLRLDDRAGRPAVASCRCFPSSHHTAVSFAFYVASAASSASVASGVELLTAGAEGDVRWWRLPVREEDDALQLVSSFRLPVKAHVTCALLLDAAGGLRPADASCSDCLLLCGDSKGNLYLYRVLRHQSAIAVHGCSRLLAVHSSFSALLFPAPGHLLSAGKEGSIHHYRWGSSSSPPSAADELWIRKHDAAAPQPCSAAGSRFVLTLTSTTRTPVHGLWSLHLTPATSSSARSSLLVSGYSGSLFQLYDVEAQTLLLSVRCGGYRRPSLLSLLPEAASARFLFASHSHSTTAASIYSHTLTLPSASEPLTVGDACHTRLVTAVRILEGGEGGRLVLTVSEDRLLKLWRLAAGGPGGGGELELRLLQTVQEHPDSIRAMAVADAGGAAHYVFTVGGRDVMRAYSLSSAAAGTGEAEVELESLGGEGSAMLQAAQGKHWLDGWDREDEGWLEEMDVRIMAVAAMPAPASASASACTLVVGDSAGLLRFYSFSPHSCESGAGSPFALLHSSAVHGHPVISLACCGAVLVSGDTAGVIRIWDVSAHSRPLPVFDLRLHQAGVNACSLSPLLPAASSLFPSPCSLTFQLLTGGDDGCICSLSFSLSSPDFRLLSQTRHEAAHYSAIKCLARCGQWLLSSGYDQRLRLWRLQQEREGKEEPLVAMSSLPLELADVCAMDVRGRELLVCGQGVSVLLLPHRVEIVPQPK